MWSKHRNRVGLPDKGFDEQSLKEFHFIRDVIDTQGLEKVAEVYSSYNLTMMREFYCEVSVTSSPNIQIRGVTIKLRGKTFNEFLNLVPPKKTEYGKLMKKGKPADLAEAAAILGKPRSEWDIHANFMLSTFKALNLNATSNVWINFVRHSISPTTHDSTIGVDRMFLLYCLLTGRSINLGRIMVQSIRECATRTRGKLYFPGMLTQLLIAAGVPQFKDDLIVREQREKWEIDMKVVNRLTNRREKGVEANDLMTVVQDLLAQNSRLMEDLSKLKEDFKVKFEALREEMLKAVESKKKQADESLSVVREVRRMEFKVQDKKDKIAKMREKIDKLLDENALLRAQAVARTGTAASNAAASSDAVGGS